jgi:phosphate transport system ATP-binding protein
MSDAQLPPPPWSRPRPLADEAGESAQRSEPILTRADLDRGLDGSAAPLPTATRVEAPPAPAPAPVAPIDVAPAPATRVDLPPPPTDRDSMFAPTERADGPTDFVPPVVVPPPPSGSDVVAAPVPQADLPPPPAAAPGAGPTRAGVTDTTGSKPPPDLVGGPPPGAATLQAIDACAWFGDHLVLEGVDLVMPAGRVTALIGPSGCGKSTFLRLLNRMHELVPGAQLDGQILLEGDDIYASGRRAQEIRTRIGMVFQKPNPVPAMSIRDNVLSGLKLARIKCNDKDVLVEASLERAGLWKEVKDRLDRPGGGLSGGQQQRLCIARSLAVRPNVLLMDEPCSALDPTSTRRVEETIAELRGEVTVVIVTHNMQQAQRVSDTCAFFLAAENQPGRVIEQGPTDIMFSTPQDPRTLDYVHGRFG